MVERVHRCLASESVGGESMAVLEADDCGFRQCPEAAVDRPWPRAGQAK
jgi:hypothetical protein